MNLFYNLKLSTKLFSGFILMALLAGAVGLTGTLKVRQISDADAALFRLKFRLLKCILCL